MVGTGAREGWERREMMTNSPTGSWVTDDNVPAAEWVEVSSREGLTVFEGLCTLTCLSINHWGCVAIDTMLHIN